MSLRPDMPQPATFLRDPTSGTVILRKPARSFVQRTTLATCRTNLGWIA